MQKRKGKHRQQIKETGYHLFSVGWVWGKEPHSEKRISEKEACSILSGGGHFLRNCFNFDFDKERQFYYLVKTKFGDYEELSSNTRNQVKKCFKQYVVKRITNEYLLENGFDAYSKSFLKYGNKNLPEYESFASFVRKCSSPIYEFWGTFNVESGKMVAFAVNFIIGDYCNYQTLKCIPDDQKKYAYYGLIFEMNKYYLKERGLSYVCDGARSITGHSGIQPFLEQKFKFQKMYCDLQVFYKPWFGMAVKMLFPFRRLIKHPKVAAILRQEAWARGKDYIA